MHDLKPCHVINWDAAGFQNRRLSRVSRKTESFLPTGIKIFKTPHRAGTFEVIKYEILCDFEPKL
jgi:hypothetical protein